MPATTRHAATLTAAALAAVLVTIDPPLAGAASPPVTTQAAAADAAFLAYAPPPPSGAGALCLVDTGVNANPDTTPGLISATAIDGGTGNDVDPLEHGTIDAAIAGGSGHGVLGAWPQLKIVSVRATGVPAAGQEPTFEFNNYVQGIKQCLQPIAGAQVDAIDLPLSSTIPPSPDQTSAFAAAVAQAQAQNITILAAAGNSPGAIELPASEPGVFAVGAGQTPTATSTSASGICSFSATAGLTFYAPGCGIDTIDPTTDDPLCCGNGTSQASAFAAAVYVALRSYDLTLTPAKATQLLLSTTSNGHLDVAAAFDTDGLGAVVSAGTSAIPAPPSPPAVTGVASAPAASAPPAARIPSPAAAIPRPPVKSVAWRKGTLLIILKSIPKGAVLHAEITFDGHQALYVATAHHDLHRHVSRPTRVLLRLTDGTASSATVSVKL